MQKNPDENEFIEVDKNNDVHNYYCMFVYELENQKDNLYEKNN